VVPRYAVARRPAVRREQQEHEAHQQRGDEVEIAAGEDRVPDEEAEVEELIEREEDARDPESDRERPPGAREPAVALDLDGFGGLRLHESDSITARPPAPMTAGASKGLPRPAGTRPLGSRSELPLLDDDLHAGLRERLGAHLHPGLGE